MTLDFSRCRLPPFKHQTEDVAWLIEHPYAFIASEMRTGKTKIVIDASQFMFEAGVIDKVIVVAPAPVRDVWADKMLGELAKHLWLTTHATITEYHARLRTWVHGVPLTGSISKPLDFYVTNFEFLRSKNRLLQLMPICGPKTLLVLDESSFVKNYAAQQTKACMQLRKACGRVVLLNGTPIFHSPMDLFSQSNILHHSVLDCKYVTLFKARYAVQEPILGYGGKALTGPRGHVIQKISSWTNLDDLQRRIGRVTVRRLQKDCLDLPPKLDPVMLTATLTPETWRAYKDMRDELVIWLKDGRVATSATAAVRVMRLAQITSGFIGGIEDAGIEPVDDISCGHGWHFGGECNDRREAATAGREGASRSSDLETPDVSERQAGGLLESDQTDCARDDAAGRLRSTARVQAIGREKLDVLLWFLGQRLDADPNLKIVVWCRFRAELFRLLDTVREAYPQFETTAIHGGQKKDERLAALRLLNPATAPVGPVCVAGTFGTGSFGLNFTAAHTSVTMSSDYSPGKHAQAADRVYGPGQTAPIAYYDIVAVGPAGQRTVDHAIVAARRAGEDVASWTCSAWVKALTEE